MSARRRPGPRRGRSLGRTVTVAVGTFVVIGLLAAVALRAPNGVPGIDHYVVHAPMRDLSGLGAHSEIRIAGKRVGQVVALRMVDGRPMVDLQLDGSAPRLHEDAVLTVRAKGLLGQRFLDVRPGTRRAATIEDGGTLAPGRSGATVDLPELFTAFDPTTRRLMGAQLDALGLGTLGQGAALNDALHGGHQLFSELGSTSRAILARPGAAQRFFPSIESAARAAEPVREDVARGFAPTARALRPLAVRRSAVRDTLDAAPPALIATRSGLHRTDPLLAQAARLARAARTSLAPAPAALRTTRALLAELPLPLRRTQTFLRAARPVIPVVDRLAGAATPELPRVDGALASALPVVRRLGPYGCDIAGFASNWRSMLGQGIPGGGTVGPLTSLRLELIEGGASPVASFTTPDPGVAATDPYPAPCTAGTERLP